MEFSSEDFLPRRQSLRLCAERLKDTVAPAVAGHGSAEIEEDEGMELQAHVGEGGNGDRCVDELPTSLESTVTVKSEPRRCSHGRGNRIANSSISTTATKRTQARTSKVARKRPYPTHPRRTSADTEHSQSDGDSIVVGKRRRSLVVKLRIDIPANFVIPSSLVTPNTIRTAPQLGLLTPCSPITDDCDFPPIDEELQRVSQAMCYRKPLGSKPATQGQPRVWAETRQALCETLPYFKALQSGCYHHDRHIEAFLRDNAGYSREYMDADVIISRVGSSMDVDRNGRLSQSKDHEMSDARVRALLNDIEYRNPLVVVCGSNCADALSQMPHRYCVLGWYKPVGIWAEKTLSAGGKARTTIKYRLERLNGEEPAWHAPVDSGTQTFDRRQYALSTNVCPACERQYPQVYLLGWMCLNVDCTGFWRIDGKDACRFAHPLDFHPGFLLHRTPWPNESPPYDLRPPIPEIGHALGDHLTYINTRGICCPECGRCSSRRLFKGWQCDNARCSFTRVVERQPVDHVALSGSWSLSGDGPALSKNRHSGKGVSLEIEYIDNYKVSRYTFDGVQGSFIHAASNSQANKAPGGADCMFRTLQVEDFRLERRTFNHIKHASIQPVPQQQQERRQSRTHAETLASEDVGAYMTAFSMNFGMPYKFSASGPSIPFEDAPETVRECRSMLDERARAFLPDTEHQPFNEELIIAYMEGQKMGYHDDGERGLGPRIASISLGGAAKMYFRRKAKPSAGCSVRGSLAVEKPTAFPVGRDADAEAWKETELGLQVDQGAHPFVNRVKRAEDALVLTLQHGDIVVMDGHDLQTYFEHKVVPTGHLRFAITCRTISKDHLTPDKRSAYPVEQDVGS